MKIFYALLGFAGAILVKRALDDHRTKIVAAPRRIPADEHAVDGSAEDEVTGPLAEI